MGVTLWEGWDVWLQFQNLSENKQQRVVDKAGHIGEGLLSMRTKTSKLRWCSGSSSSCGTIFKEICWLMCQRDVYHSDMNVTFNYCYSFCPNTPQAADQVSPAVALWTGVRGIPDSNHGWDTYYADCILWFSSCVLPRLGYYCFLPVLFLLICHCLSLVARTGLQNKRPTFTQIRSGLRDGPAVQLPGDPTYKGR
jgi:hypothetical protein